MIYTLAYILLTAVSFVLIHQLGVGLPKMLMVLLSTAYAIFFFHVINYKTIAGAYRKAFRIKKDYAVILISVLFMWGGSYLIPIYYSPAIQVFTFMLSICVWGAFFTYRHTHRTTDLIIFILCSFILCVFYIIYYQVYPLKSFLIMLFGTLLTGTAAYVYFWQSQKLLEFQFTSTEILAIRFWLLLLVPLMLVIEDQSYLLINWRILGETLLLSCFTLIFPIYCCQKSIEKIGANLHSVLIAITPFVTFLLEKSVMKTTTNAIGYLSIILAVVIFIPWIRASLTNSSK